MKRLVIVLILLFAAAIIFAQSPAAVVKEMTGTVELKKSESSGWVAAKVGDKIEKSTIISTGFKSTAILTVGSSTLTVRPLTRLALEDLLSQNETETVNIKLNTGRIRAEVSPPAGRKANFNVQTPSSTASVRGTSFAMDTVSLKVITGTVSYTPSSSRAAARPVMVNAGQESLIDADTGIAVTPMAAAEAAFLEVSGRGTGAGSRSGVPSSKGSTGESGLTIDVELKPKK